MKKNTFIILVLAVATGCSHKITGNSTGTNGTAQTVVDTRPTVTLVKGQKYIIENKITTTSSSEMQGQSMETNADVTSTYDIEVNDIKDDNYNMINKLTAIKLNMATMGQNVSFDSDNKEDMNGDMGSSLKDYINHPNTVVMDKSGKVIVANKTDSAKENDATSPTQMMLKQIGDPEQQGYGAKMAFMPVSKTLKTGTAWKDSTSDNGITKVTNYVVKAINGNVATLSVSGTEMRDTKMEMQGMEINTKTKGTFSGEETVDITTGVILENNSTMDASGNISVMGQEIPTKVKAVSVTTVKPM
ncbi:MAG TPA: DUF6263 family protein [Ginsengibacter sp.]|nr:DUF6263 family protein [Ginsengibacter sp.]